MKLKTLTIILLIIFAFSGCSTAPDTKDSPGFGFTSAEQLPWIYAPFSAPPEEVLAAADAITLEGEQDVRILHHEGVFTFDKEGRLESRIRWVYKILNQEGVENWASTKVSWSPWNENKPEIHVRVINPDGGEYFLSEGHLVENGSSVDSKKLYSDRKTLSAPFPRVTIGSIIEEEIVTSEHAPFYKEGTVKTWYFQTRNPMLMNRLVIEVPEGLPFQYKNYLLPNLQPVVEKTGSFTRYIFEASNVEVSEDVEEGLPLDHPHWAYVGFSTGRSWQEIAESYSRIVDEKLANEDLSGIITDHLRETPKDTAVAMIYWLSERVRYTGLELGENSIIPVPPSVCLDRGFGDCKDKATLLVGMLRQAGIPANVALIRADTSRDVETELPGMGRFNHAIVYVGGKEPFWIDPTSDLSRDGYLPLWDQGRSALIAAPETTGLEKTGISTAEMNLTKEIRTYHLIDAGYADVTEYTEYTGANEVYYRSRYTGVREDSLNESLEKYIKENYRFGEKVDFTYGDPLDLLTPFTITLKIEGAGRAITEEVEAFGAVMQAEILGELPDIITVESDDPRVNDYMFYRPFVYEWIHRFLPPAGFVARSLPENESLHLGTMVLDKTFNVLDDGTIEVIIRLNSGKKIISNEEFEATREAVLDFSKLSAIMISFEHEAERLLYEERYGDAIRRLTELSMEEPEKAIHPQRLSKVLLTAGIGDEALRVIRRAVDLEPDDSEVWEALAWILQHDEVGRRFEPGYARSEAIEAYEKAISLDPDEWSRYANLAILLEHDDMGMRYTDGADIDSAIEKYLHIYNELDEEKMLANLVAALFRVGRYDEIQTWAEKLSNDLEKDSYMLTAVTARDGVEAGVRRAGLIHSVDQRRKVLVEAADLLIHLRMYSKGEQLLREAARGSGDAFSLESRADRIYGTVPWEERSFDLHDPQDLISRFVIGRLTLGSVGEQVFADICTDNFLSSALDRETADNLYEFWNLSRRNAHSSGIPLAVILDFAISDLKLVVDGDERTGYHIKMYGAEGDRYPEEIFYVIPGQDGLKIAATTGYRELIGKQLLKFLTDGNFKAATAWIDWYYDDFSYEPDKDEVLANKPFRAGWMENKDPSMIRYIAASIMASGSTAEEAAKILEVEKRINKDRSMIHDFNYALAIAYVNSGDMDKYLEFAEILGDEFPESERVFRLYEDALINKGRFEEAIEIANDRQEKDFEDSAAEQLLRNIYTLQVDQDNLEVIFKQMEAEQTVNASFYNTMAWIELFGPEITGQALQRARTAVKLSGSENSAILHTLAALYAETGRVTEARKIMDRVLALTGQQEPDSDAWYVLGRIAEEYGVIDAAVRAYNRVERPEDEINTPISSWVLAQRRLKGLSTMK